MRPGKSQGVEGRCSVIGGLVCQVRGEAALVFVTNHDSIAGYYGFAAKPNYDPAKTYFQAPSGERWRQLQRIFPPNLPLISLIR